VVVANDDVSRRPIGHSPRTTITKAAAGVSPPPRLVITCSIVSLLALPQRVSPLAVERVQPLGLDDVETRAGDASLQRDGLRVRDRAGLRAQEAAVPQVRVDETRQIAGVHLHAAVRDRLQFEVPGKAFEGRPELAGGAGGPIEEHVEADVFFARLT